MEANFSFCGTSSLPSHAWSFDTSYEMMQRCMAKTPGFINISLFTVLSLVVILPLCVLVLCHWWRRRHSGAATSHTDFFTYNMAVADVTRIGGGLAAVCGTRACVRWMVYFSNFLLSMMFTAQVALHLLTCVERHLAVVHPVAYRSLRNERGVWIRNLAVVGAWAWSLGSAIFQYLSDILVILSFYICISVVSISIVAFCSVSVLCVLIRPAPGEGGGARKQGDPSKVRAFFTIVAILGVLSVKFGGNVIATVIYSSMTLSLPAACGLWLSELWFSLPCSLLLPLLHLQRTRRLRHRENSQ